MAISGSKWASGHAERTTVASPGANPFRGHRHQSQSHQQPDSNRRRVPADSWSRFTQKSPTWPPRSRSDFLTRSRRGANRRFSRTRRCRSSSVPPIPNERAPLGVKAMEHGKDFMVDKPAATTLEQLAELRRVQARRSRIFSVLIERHESRSINKAGELIRAGAIGKGHPDRRAWRRTR